MKMFTSFCCDDVRHPHFDRADVGDHRLQAGQRGEGQGDTSRTWSPSEREPPRWMERQRSCEEVAAIDNDVDAGGPA